MLYIDDLSSGKKWASGVTEEHFDMEAYGVNEKNMMNFRSLFSFDYVDTTNNVGRPQTSFSESETGTVAAEKLADGVRLTYNFARLGIEITTEFVLEDGRLHALIPADGIRESGNNVVLTVDILPFMGAADRFVEGYILVPQGCGALVRFDTFLESPDVAPMQFGVYGRKLVSNWDYWANAATGSGYYEALLPLYGVRHRDAAFLAVAEGGKFDSVISVVPGSDALPLTYACFRFTMRYQFDVMLSNLSGQNATVAVRTDRSRIERDCGITFTFLSGEDACYSGMAREYRSYLLENGTLKNATLDGEMPLGVEFFMGALEQRPLGDVYIPMTTYSQAAEIVGMLQELGVGRMDVSLNAWHKGGYAEWLLPSNLNPERRLGGKSGFVEMSAALSEKGIPLYARVNYMLPGYQNYKYSHRSDQVLRGSGVQTYILRASAGLRLLNRELNGFSKLGSGVMFEQAGLYLYHDYTRNGGLIPRSEVASDMLAQFKAVTDAGLQAAVEGANDYLLSSVSRIYDMPIVDGGYALFDEAVPFLPMVIHGSIPYTANAGNLFYNHSTQILTWVEFGAMPFYQLMWEHPNDLKYTDANWLFSGKASDWAGQAAEVYLDMNDRLGTVWGRQMLSHERPMPGVARIEYDGGYSVIVNYNETEVVVDGFVVPALDYKVVRQ